MKYILSKKFVASHELTLSLEIRASSKINYIFGIFVKGGGGGGGGGSYQLCRFHCLVSFFDDQLEDYKDFLMKLNVSTGHAPRLP